MDSKAGAAASSAGTSASAAPQSATLEASDAPSAEATATTPATPDRGTPWGTLTTVGVLALGGVGVALRTRWRS